MTFRQGQAGLPILRFAATFEGNGPASGTLTPTGGVVRVAIANDIASLDPWTSPDPTSQLVLRQVFETLVDLEPGGFRVVPKLAEKWTVSGDGRSWTFTLRAGVQFHDGTALDASAVAANFQRGLGFARFDLASVVSAVTAPTPTAVVFELKTPYAPLLATLASPSFGIVSPACLKQGPSWFSPASRCAAQVGDRKMESDVAVPDHAAAVRLCLKQLVELGVLGRDAPVHRLILAFGARIIVA